MSSLELLTYLLHKFMYLSVSTSEEVGAIIKDYACVYSTLFELRQKLLSPFLL